MKKVVNQAVGTLTAVADTSYFTISSFPITEEGIKKRNVELKRNEPVNEIGDELSSFQSFRRKLFSWSYFCNVNQTEIYLITLSM